MRGRGAIPRSPSGYFKVLPLILAAAAIHPRACPSKNDSVTSFYIHMYFHSRFRKYVKINTCSECGLQQSAKHHFLSLDTHTHTHVAPSGYSKQCALSESGVEKPVPISGHPPKESIEA